MGFAENRPVWETHYARERSRQEVPDENVVRYLHRFLRENQKRPLRALDLGSGSGRNLNYIRSLPIEAYGCDFSFNALRGQQNVCCSIASELPFKDSSFDLVIVWGVLHYLPEDLVNNTLREILRVLKPGGKLLATLRSSDDTHLAGTLERGDLTGGQARLFTQAEAKRLLGDFSDLRFGYISRVPLGESGVVAHHVIEGTRG